jgi:hypothetical protein
MLPPGAMPLLLAVATAGADTPFPLLLGGNTAPLPLLL